MTEGSRWVALAGRLSIPATYAIDQFIDRALRQTTADRRPPVLEKRVHGS